MRWTRFASFIWISCIASLVGMLLTPRSGLNKALSVIACAIFSINSTFCNISALSSGQALATEAPVLLAQNISRQTYNTPTVRGVPIDATVWENDSNPLNEQAALQEGANLFCKWQGYDYANSWSVGKNQRITIERGTYRFNRGTVINPTYCNFCRWHLSLVSCVRGQVASNNQSPQISQGIRNSSGRSETQEMRLYQLVNQYRTQYGLPAIPLSPSLSYVARSHVRDLYSFNVDNCRGLHCRHGWSNCPYDANNRETLPCMWEAPQRLGTPYPGNGYEILATSYGAISPEQALQVWQRSSGHNGVIINHNPWNKPWNAMGVGINGRYAAVWFGNEPDPAK